ncbi:MAG: cation:proton antiporter, partial [Candidatus Cloacimonadaceae bacterium]|nr:cation:proton antiporter [Candidatus Cloacimonadaceae bacterium]
MGYLSLPAVIGMIFAGILIGVCFGGLIPQSLYGVEPFLKSMALIIILLRAGLGINRKMLQKTGKTALLLSFVPCMFEGITLMLAFHYLMGFSFEVAGIAAFMLSAVSPAVIVPSMLDLKERGYGANKQVPTLILAGASVDDVFAITMFSIFLKLQLSGQRNLTADLLHIPYSIGMGILLGLVLGFLLVKFYRHYYHKIRATEKVLVLLGLCLVLVEFGDMIQIASLLGAMTIGYVLFERENRVAKEISQKLSKLWIFAEIVLFVLIGISLKPSSVVDAGWKSLAIIFIGLAARSVGVILATAFSKLNKREKLFCVIAFLPKATVQAALGSVP